MKSITLIDDAGRVMTLEPCTPERAAQIASETLGETWRAETERAT